MRAIALPCLLLAAAFAAVPSAPALARQGAIHRCTDRAGRPVFTDRRCADLDATPAPRTPTAPTVPGQPEPPPAPALCAADPAELRELVADALAADDANRLAGLVLWNGHDRHDVITRITELAALTRQPLLDLRLDQGVRIVRAPAAAALYDASRPLADVLRDTPSSTAGQDTAAQQLTLVTGPLDADGRGTPTRFALTRQSGCVWLLPPD